MDSIEIEKALDLILADEKTDELFTKLLNHIMELGEIECVKHTDKKQLMHLVCDCYIDENY